MLTRLLRSFLRPYIRQVAIVVILLVAQTIGNLYLPNLNADIINNGVERGTSATSGLLPFTLAAGGFAGAILAAALVPSLAGELAALVVVGFFSTAFMATGNTTLQLTADPEFRGRVMALWSVTFTGSTPVGGPIVGVVADDLAPRYGLGPSPVCPPPTDTPGAPANSTGPPTSKPTRPAHS